MNSWNRLFAGVASAATLAILAGCSARIVGENQTNSGRQDAVVDCDDPYTMPASGGGWVWEGEDADGDGICDMDAPDAGTGDAGMPATGTLAGPQLFSAASALSVQSTPPRKGYFRWVDELWEYCFGVAKKCDPPNPPKPPTPPKCDLELIGKLRDQLVKQEELLKAEQEALRNLIGPPRGDEIKILDLEERIKMRQTVIDNLRKKINAECPDPPAGTNKCGLGSDVSCLGLLPGAPCLETIVAPTTPDGTGEFRWGVCATFPPGNDCVCGARKPTL
jgi:hypothetical protein